MDLHKPKSWHGWRDFLKEFATIVLGVSVALAAEQGVEWLHWRTQVSEAKEIIAAEMTLNVRQATYRVRSVPCIERRLDELAAILDGASKTGVLPPLGDIGIPPRGFWNFGGWESVVASQTATHFPRQQLADLTSLYRVINGQSDFSAQEIVAWNSLYAMVGPGRRLDPASEAKLRDALSQARAMIPLLTGPSGAIIRRAKALGLPFSREDLASISNAETVSLSDPTLTGNIGAICPPIGAIPFHYGQAMYDSGRQGNNAPQSRFSDGKPQAAP